MAMEIARALKLFAELARDDSLDAATRARVGSMAIEVRSDDGDVADEILRLSHMNIAAVTGVTSMDPSRFKGGTIHVSDLEVGS